MRKGPPRYHLGMFTSSTPSKSRQQFRLAVLLLFLTYLSAAFFSQGFLDTAEHFMVLETANYKLGLTPKEALPDSVALKSQSWLLPAVVVALAKVTSVIIDFDPFCIATTLRILAALLAIFAALTLMRAADGWFDESPLKKVVLFGLSLIWFLPLLSARFSAEGVSRSLFLLAYLPLIISVQQDRCLSRWTAFASGVLIALAFEAHYWSLFLIIPASVWFLCFGRNRISTHAWLKAGSVVGLLLVALLNRWGYGHWAFPAAPYFYQHLFLVRVAGETAPWWNYFIWLITESPPVWGLTLIFGSLWAWTQKPKLSLTWITAFYFLSLLFYSPRALVDLSPLACFAWIPILLAMQKLVETRPTLFQAQALRFLYTILLVTNLFALGYATVSPAQSEIPLFRSVWNYGVNRLYSLEQDPYAFHGKNSFFYRRADLKVFTGVSQFDIDKKIQAGGEDLFVAAHLFEEGGIFLRSHPHCKPLDAKISHWIGGTEIERLIRLHWRPWALFLCRK